ncbi:MAG TPA: cyclase family protein, partial [Solirubrobacterales bacterium]|nr:cyclase family protein [Solirubrobacterales bacterium]
MLPSGRIIDLTQPLGPGTLLWPGSPSVEFTDVGSIAEDGYFARMASLPEHAGTHLDAPAHFDPDGATADGIPAERLVVRCMVLDAAARCHEDPGTRIGAAEIEELEHAHGAIEPGSALLLRTGWARCRDDPEAFFGTADGGTSMRFPGFDTSAADFLVARGAVGVGTDTLSVDPGEATDFPAHKVTLPAGLWHLEGLV